MPANSKKYQREYMRKYIKNSDYKNCSICGKDYKSYNKDSHDKTQFHQRSVKKLENPIEQIFNKETIKEIFGNQEFQDKLNEYISEIKTHKITEARKPSDDKPSNEASFI